MAESAPAYEQFYASDRDGVNTLFVSGLPDDVKAREIHNLFRRRPGFDYCQLKYTGRGNQVVAFATFFNHQSAVGALHALNGVKFDPQTGAALHIELARSNSRRKRKPGSGPYVVIDNRKKEDDNAQETSSNEGNNNHETSSNAGESESNEASDDENEDSDGKEDDLVTSKSSENPVAVVSHSDKVVDGNQCSTLFIANLGPNCTEDELEQVLSHYPGFNVLKLRNRSGMPVAFADFEDIEQANRVMEELNGTVLPSSDRGGMHIEYARSKMRKT